MIKPSPSESPVTSTTKYRMPSGNESKRYKIARYVRGSAKTEMMRAVQVRSDVLTTVLLI
jgi:hypothetical protein